jgi:7,8-dihydropterin-6-yl-methyl-4-(beta-D-ribofuranosyl)aminobenzene 5'-phosphate synthase
VILKILFDNEASSGLKSGWGFSCLVNEHLLFDTGANADTLLYNMHKLDVNLDKIDKIVLSHPHGDHTGGLGIIKLLPKVEVFVPISFSNRFKKDLDSLLHVEVIEVDKMMQIEDNIHTTGELGRGGWTKEQSLIVQTDNGLTVITGCSHPGLDRIVNVASELGNIYGVLGGFHGFSQLEILKDYEFIVPCHCTTKKREILTLYPDSCKECAVGCVFTV